jgi:hypothetical protein
LFPLPGSPRTWGKILARVVKTKSSTFVLPDAPLIEKSSNLFKSDLLKINELKPLFEEWSSKSRQKAVEIVAEPNITAQRCSNEE